jgi:hypothetical protein
MIFALAAVAAVVSVAVLLKKYHTASAATAAVKAEIAKIESEVVAAEPVMKAKVLSVVARVKALL